MIISIIAAMAKNRVIGRNNYIPWKLPEDMKRFKELTTGKPVVMGRKTFESIGRPLPNRANIIVTRDKNYKADNCVVVHSAGEAIKAAKGNEEVMIIGGAEIYKQFLPRADRLYLTLIDKEFEGDAYFPEFDKNEWEEVSREEHESNGLRYAFVNLERK